MSARLGCVQHAIATVDVCAKSLLPMSNLDDEALWFERTFCAYRNAADLSLSGIERLT
jgi:hypothetical protein